MVFYFTNDLFKAKQTEMTLPNVTLQQGFSGANLIICSGHALSCFASRNNLAYSAESVLFQNRLDLVLLASNTAPKYLSVLDVKICVNHPKSCFLGMKNQKFNLC